MDEIKENLWCSWWTWQVWILSFLWKITVIHGENNQKKNLDTEEVTAIFHDFQEPVCFSVTSPWKCHDFKCMPSLCTYTYKISMAGVTCCEIGTWTTDIGLSFERTAANDNANDTRRRDGILAPVCWSGLPSETDSLSGLPPSHAAVGGGEDIRGDDEAVQVIEILYT